MLKNVKNRSLKVRALRWVLLIVGLALCALIAGLLFAENLLRGALSDALGSPVQLEHLSLAWNEPITLQRVVLPDAQGRGALLELQELSLSGGLAGLVFSNDALSLTAQQCRVHLRKEASGATNIDQFLGGASGDGKTAPVAVPRRVELAIHEGQLSVDNAAVCSFTLSASAEGTPLRGRARVELQPQGGGTLTCALLLRSGAAAESGCDVELRGEGVDLAVFAPLLRLWIDVIPAGKVQRLACAATFEGTSPQDVSVDFEVTEFALGTQVVNARPLPFVKVNAKAHCVDGVPETLRATLETTAARVELEAPRLQLAGQLVRGSCKFNGTVNDAALLADALPAVLPLGVRPAGSLGFNVQAEGQWDLQAQDWMAQVSALQGTAQLRLAQLSTPSVALTDIVAAVTLDKGVLHVSDFSAVDEAASISGEFTLPLLGGTVAGALNIRGALPLHFDGGGVRCTSAITGGVRFSGTIEQCEASFDLKADECALEWPGGTPVVLKRVSLNGSAFAEQRFRSLRLQQTALLSEGLSLELASARFDTESHAGGAKFEARIPGRVLRPWLPVDCVLEGNAQLRGELSVAALELRNCTAQWSVTLPRISWRDESLSQVQAELRLHESKLQIDKCSASYAGGRLNLAGTVDLGAAPWNASGTLACSDIKLERDVAAAGRVVGVCSGQWNVSATGVGDFGVQGTGSVPQLLLQQDDGRTLALNNVVLAVHAQRQGQEWTVSDTNLAATEGWIKVRSAQASAEARNLRADMAWSVDGAWLSTIAEAFSPGMLRIEGASTGSVVAQCSDPLDATTWSADVKATLQSVSVSGLEFRGLQADGALNAGRLNVRELRAGHSGGVLIARGDFGVDATSRKASDHLVLTLQDLPVEHVGLVETPNSKGEALTTLRVSGTVEARSSAALEAQLSVDLKLSGLARSLRDKTKVLKTVKLPDLQVQGEGSLRSAGMEFSLLRVNGEGVAFEAARVLCTAERLVVKDFALKLPPVFMEALLVSPEAPLAVQHGEMQVAGTLDAPCVAWIPDVFRGVGTCTANLDALAFDTLTLQGLRCAAELRGGALEVREATATLGGGSLRVDPGARAALVDGSWSVNAKVHATGVDIARVPNKQLSILSPLFFLGEQPDEKATVAGLMDLDVDVRLQHGGKVLWSKSAVADGRLQIVGLRLSSTVMFLDVMAKLPALFGARLPTIAGFDVQAALGTVQAAMAQGVSMDKLTTSLQIREGRVSLDKGLKLPMAGLMLTLDGWTTLDGMVNCRIGTDVMEKLAARVTGGQGGVSLLGALLSGTGLLKRMNLGIEIRGNLIQTEGRRALDIQPVLGGG